MNQEPPFGEIWTDQYIRQDPDDPDNWIIYDILGEYLHMESSLHNAREWLIDMCVSYGRLYGDR